MSSRGGGGGVPSKPAGRRRRRGGAQKDAIFAAREPSAPAAAAGPAICVCEEMPKQRKHKDLIIPPFNRTSSIIYNPRSVPPSPQTYGKKEEGTPQTTGGEKSFGLSIRGPRQRAIFLFNLFLRFLFFFPSLFSSFNYVCFFFVFYCLPNDSE